MGRQADPPNQDRQLPTQVLTEDLPRWRSQYHLQRRIHFWRQASTVNRITKISVKKLGNRKIYIITDHISIELERQTATTTVGNARGTRKHIKMGIKQSWMEAANSGHRYEIPQNVNEKVR